MTYKTPNEQRAVLPQAGCLFADSSVIIWNLTARRNLSESTSDRQAVGRYR